MILAEALRLSTWENQVLLMYVVLMDLLITPELHYIESEANPADPISRGEPGPVGKQIVPAFTLPEELAICFVDV